MSLILGQPSAKCLLFPRPGVFLRDSDAPALRTSTRQKKFWIVSLVNFPLCCRNQEIREKEILLGIRGGKKSDKIKQNISLPKTKKNFVQLYQESGEQEASQSTCMVRCSFLPLVKGEKRQTANKPRYSWVSFSVLLPTAESSPSKSSGRTQV